MEDYFKLFIFCDVIRATFTSTTKLYETLETVKRMFIDIYYQWEKMDLRVHGNAELTKSRTRLIRLEKPSLSMAPRFDLNAHKSLQ